MSSYLPYKFFGGPIFVIECVDLVYHGEIVHDAQPFWPWHEGPSFFAHQPFVAVEPYDQHVAQRPCRFEITDMARVYGVKSPGYEYDSFHMDIYVRR
jgi:hypothetical protein